MATSASPDTGEDVSDFLRRIKELGNQRDDEDLERTRKLEEEIMQSRKQREARRAERARSLSPEKRSSPDASRLVHSPSIMQQEQEFSVSSVSLTRTLETDRKQGISMAESDRPSREQPLAEIRNSQEEPRKGHEVFANDTPSHAMPSRSATLSWQQRPDSTRGPRNRPLSMIERQASPSPSGVVSKDDPESEQSRANIAERLESKAASFFRQTSNRGFASPAYRKSQVEYMDTAEYSHRDISEGHQLHGLAQWSTRSETLAKTDHPQSASNGDDVATTIDVAKSDMSDPSKANAHAISTDSSTPISRLVPSAQVMQDSGVQRGSHDFSRSPTRIDRRPASPTKGLGGFVSSAMLRSDSVSKRWNDHPTGSGLTRQDSVVRSRRLGRSDSKDEGATANVSSGGAILTMPSTRNSRGQYSETTPRSGHDHADSIEPEKKSSQQDFQRTFSDRPASPPAERISTTSTPSSPSKRWSPSKSKSSWLESALGKPESPKPQSHSPVRSQPAWLADLNRTRQQRLSKDIPSDVVGKISSESTPSKAANTFNNTSSLDKREDEAANAHVAQMPELKTKPARVSEGSKTNEKEISARIEDMVPTIIRSDEMLETASDPSPAVPLKASLSTTNPSTPPKPDFRSQSRPTPTFKGKATEEPEFRNALGRLKRAQTQNYKAPDVLKKNILAGKAALALTDGPQKTDHRDEFKESLLERKKAMKENASDPHLLHKPKPSKGDAEAPVPEAVARKRALTGGKQNARSQSPTIKSSGNKLAERFNPTLANLIARGPLSPASADSAKSADRELSGSTVIGAVDRPCPVKEPQANGQLHHMTKMRAKGPKRRAPKGMTITSPAATGTDSHVTSEQDLKSQVLMEPVLTPEQSIPSRKGPIPPSSSRKVFTPATKPKASPAEDRSSKPDSSFSVVSPSKNNGHSVADTASNSMSSLSRAHDEKRTFEVESAISKPLTALTTRNVRPKSISVKDATARWGAQAQERDTPKQQPILSPEPEMSATPPQLISNISPQDTPTQEAPNPNRLRSQSIESENARATPMQQRYVSISSTAEIDISPNSQVPNAEKVLLDFFGEIPKKPSTLDVDTAKLLANSTANQGKVLTVRKDLVEILSDGTKVPCSPNQEHILYDESMYLCYHVFEDEEAARTTEIYLWIGSGVSESSVKDVMISSKQAARKNDGVFVTFRKGKETARFIQALGGILVTRNSRSKMNRPEIMLCGRRHLGHMVFDEVSFSLSSLTAAFPFIIQAQPGKTHLWKGLGCHAEEIGAARLIAMDLAAADEVVEMEQGKETEDFTNMFPEPRQIPRSAEHWKHKPGQKNYQSRLFKVTHGLETSGSGQRNTLWGALRGQPSLVNGILTEAQQMQVEEIHPFIQSDLGEEHVYVLDTFFEIYVLPGAASRSRASKSIFATALLFAQEYGILAASSEDRPFVPIGIAVMSGAPRDMKVSFRAWNEGHLDSAALLGGTGSGRRGHLKILGLASALAALKTE